MDIKLKPGGGNQLQPYLAEGHGDKSGEYTNKNCTYSDFASESYAFCKSQYATKTDLEKTLSKEELQSIRYYTVYENGIMLNRSIRNNNLTPLQLAHVNYIVRGINKHYIGDIQVYRGIFVNEEVMQDFVIAKSKQTVLTGGLICSTSRHFQRALDAAYTSRNCKYPIVFECNLPKNTNGLPVEDIAYNRNEGEILLSAPRYKIDDIIKISSKNKIYYKIKIHIV